MAEKLFKTEDKKLQQVVLYEIVKLLKAENTQDTEGHRSFESLLNGKFFLLFMLIIFLSTSSAATTI